MSRKTRNNRKRKAKRLAAKAAEQEAESVKLEDSLEVKSEALSFEELEKEDEMEEKLEKAEDLVVDAHFLMSNIAGSELDPEEKEKSVATLAKEMTSRLLDFAGVEEKEKKSEEVAFDTDLEYGKMLLRLSEGNVLERVAEKVKTYDDGEFPMGNKTEVRYTLRKHIELIESGEEEYRKDLDEIFEVAKEFGIGVPNRKDENSLFVTKDAEGGWRWFGVVSNNFKDRDGEIVSEEAHKDYVAFLDEKPQLAPEFWSWHTAGTARKERADWWGYENGFLMMSGKLNEKEANGLIRAASSHNLGMSHGFFARKEGKVITKYRSFEVSDLPLEVAANPWTTLEAINKETNMSKKLDYLTELFGEEFATEVVEITAEAQEELREEGVDEKEVKKEEKKVEKEEEPKVEEKAELSDEVIETLAKALGLDELSEQFEKILSVVEALPTITEKIAELEKSDDEKIAEKVTPPIAKARFAWQKRLSQDDENVAEDDEKILKDVPEAESWFTRAVQGESE